MSGKLWWHVYGSVVDGWAEDSDTGEPCGAWMGVTYGESAATPERVAEKFPTRTVPLGDEQAELTYLGSFDHQPSDAEHDALKPDEYRDDPIPDTPQEAAREAAQEHVHEILFDSSSEAEPTCVLCKAASRLKLWQELGYDDPLAEGPR